MDDECWSRLLQRLPEPEPATGPALAVAFVGADDYAAKGGKAWLWWPGSREKAPGPVDFDGRYPMDWGLLLVMNELATERVCAEGLGCMAHLSRLLDIKPFVLRERDALDAGGVLDFIEDLELATPKH